MYVRPAARDELNITGIPRYRAPFINLKTGRQDLSAIHIDDEQE